MAAVLQEREVIWRPLPGSQALALSCPATEILHGGTRGGGKTECQLMRFRRLVGKGYGAFWRGVIFDREYKNLEDIIAKSLRWFTLFGDGAKYVAGGGGGGWRWPTGEVLLFRHIKKLADYWKYHGHEYPFIGFNELGKYPTSELYEMMKSCNRSSFIPEDHPVINDDGSISILPDIPLELFSTANPFGPGTNWIRKKFVDVAPPGRIVRKTTMVFNPRTQREEQVETTQCYIFSSYKENFKLSPEYVADLVNNPDPTKRKAWLSGDWNIVAGGALDDVWGDHLLLERFPIPKEWIVDRSFDWGSTRPFSVGWWAEANGEEVVLPDGTKWCPVKGSLIRIFEWYGSDDIGTNKGLKLGPKAVAKGILERERLLVEQKWIAGTPKPGPADNAIADQKDGATLPSIKRRMEKAGVKWTASRKTPGSRKQGLELMREMMLHAKTGEGPGLFFFRNCSAAIETLPTLPRDEKNLDDVDSEAEDHAYDEIRYRIMNLRRLTVVGSLRS